MAVVPVDVGDELHVRAHRARLLREPVPEPHVAVGEVVEERLARLPRIELQTVLALAKPRRAVVWAHVKVFRRSAFLPIVDYQIRHVRIREAELEARSETWRQAAIPLLLDAVLRIHAEVFGVRVKVAVLPVGEGMAVSESVERYLTHPVSPPFLVGMLPLRNSARGPETLRKCCVDRLLVKAPETSDADRVQRERRLEPPLRAVFQLHSAALRRDDSVVARMHPPHAKRTVKELIHREKRALRLRYPAHRVVAPEMHLVAADASDRLERRRLGRPIRPLPNHKGNDGGRIGRRFGRATRFTASCDQPQMPLQLLRRQPARGIAALDLDLRRREIKRCGVRAKRRRCDSGESNADSVKSSHKISFCLVFNAAYYTILAHS